MGALGPEYRSGQRTGQRSFGSQREKEREVSCEHLQPGLHDLCPSAAITGPFEMNGHKSLTSLHKTPSQRLANPRDVTGTRAGRASARTGQAELCLSMPPYYSLDFMLAVASARISPPTARSFLGDTHPAIRPFPLAPLRSS